MSDSIATTCGITGASGYLGSRLSSYFQKKDWTVCEMSRKPKESGNGQALFLPFTLGESIEPSKLTNLSALIHCAYDFRVVNWSDIYKVNVKGSIDLFTAAAKAGVKKLVFISTMSAFDGCRSNYGKAKLQIEDEVVKLGGTVIRPGLIYGNQAGGMVGALNKMLSISSLLPLVGFGGYPLYLIHEADLCDLVFDVTANNQQEISSPIIAAHDNARTFKSILQELANAKNKKPHFIPVPWQLMWMGLKAGEIVGLPVGFRSDSLLSLVNQDRNPDFKPIRSTGVLLRDFNARAMSS